MNIVFASDNSYLEHLAVSMCSLFENNQGASFDVYIVNANIDKSSWRELELLTRRYGHTLIDVKIVDYEVDGLVTSHHFTKANYYRLFIPEKIPVQKALYLDADIVVTGSISELYSTSLDGYYLAAVIDPGFKRHADLGMSEDSKYFNSGVMLLNLEAWRRDDIKIKVIDVVKHKPWAIQAVDQCGLNSVVNGQWKELHPQFNLQGALFDNPGHEFSDLFPGDDLLAALQSPVIIHFSGSLKPWSFRYKHPWRKLYWKYLRMTPFSHWFSKDLTLFNIVKWSLPKGIKQAIKSKFRQE